MRIIKKYPNRRLYDTEISCYITLEDIKKLVMSSVEFVVKDARSEEDLTNSTLLQIISEQEEQGSPMLTKQILQNMIRFYGNSLQGLMSNFLEESMNVFIQQQDNLQKQFGQFSNTSMPFNILNEITKQNIEIYRVWQNNLLNYFNHFKPKDH